MPPCLALSVKDWIGSKSLRHTGVMSRVCVCTSSCLMLQKQEIGSWPMGLSWPSKAKLLRFLLPLLNYSGNNHVREIRRHFKWNRMWNTLLGFRVDVAAGSEHRALTTTSYVVVLLCLSSHTSETHTNPHCQALMGCVRADVSVMWKRDVRGGIEGGEEREESGE